MAHQGKLEKLMTPENFDQILGAMLSRDPFQIFTIELQSGKRFEIDHPRTTVYREGVAVFIAPGGVPVWFDHETVSQIIEAPADTAP
jgi:hypothetical protein